MTDADKNSPVEPSEYTTGTRIEPAAFKPVTGVIRQGRKVGPGSVVTGVILLVCFAIAWFVFTAKSIYIKTDPAGAEINIDGGINIKLADRYLIGSGAYTISISAAGHYPINQTLIVDENQNQHFPFTLERLPGHLSIHTLPAVAAEIWIGDELKGTTPLTIRELPHASYSVRALTERYFPFEGGIEIEGKDLEQELAIELIPAWAEVRISSQPAGSDIYIDDNLAGQTPATTEILQGEHSIRIQVAGYKPWTDRIRVTANEPLDLSGVILEPADAVVLLETKPVNASITVDGVYHGQTPVEVALTPGTEANIRFFREGYQRATRTVTAISGDHQQILVVLNPELTAVEINSDPADAKLYVDGILRGSARQTLQLSTNPHKIEIRKEGYVDYTTTITPRTGIAQQIQVKLKTLRQARLEAIKPIIKTAAGQTLKLFYPGQFTMGASRREAGRRANETLRNIELTRPFYLSLHEVSNAEYRVYAKSHSSGENLGYDLNGDNQPVVNLGWDQAALYCNWLSEQDSIQAFYIVKNNKVIGYDLDATGYRLPTEAEWSWAARTRNGKELLKYPWGETYPPTVMNGNYADDAAADLVGYLIPEYRDNHAVTAPTGSFPANEKGLFDMGGNVSEWTNDIYDIPVASPNSLERDPTGPTAGDHHVIRGSSWAHGSIRELRLSYRDYGSAGKDDIGFRIARFME